MPAKTEKQQRAMGMALAAKRGKIKKSKLSPSIRKMVDSMSEETLKEFASTKHSDIKKAASSIEYSPSQAAFSSLAAGAGTYGGIQLLNTLDLAFGLPRKLKNVNKAITTLENISKSNTKGDLSYVAKLLLKSKDDLSNLYKLRDELTSAINSQRKDLIGGITQQGHSILHNNLLGNKLTERIINNSLRNKIFPSKLNACMGNYCPIGRRAILAGTLALLGASLGGLRKKKASYSDISISYDIPKAINAGGTAGAVGLGTVLLSNELGKRKLFEDLFNKAKTKSLSEKDVNKLLRLIAQKSGVYNSDITGYAEEQIRKSLPYERFSKSFNDNIRSALGFISPKTKLPVKAKNKLVESILKRTTPLTAFIGLSTLLGGLSLKKQASTNQYNFDPLNIAKGFALGAGGASMANEIIGDYIPAVINHNLLDKIYLPSHPYYPYSIDNTTGKLNVDMNKFKKLTRLANMVNSNMSSALPEDLAEAKTLRDAKNLFYSTFNLPKKHIASLEKNINKLETANEYLKGSYGALNPIINILEKASKTNNNIKSKFFSFIVDKLKDPKNLKTKSYAQQFFNPKYMRTKTKLVYLMGLLGSLMSAGINTDKTK